MRNTSCPNTRHLSEDERIEIADLVQAVEGVRAIARRLGRSPSTISRELRRNAHPRDSVYRPRRAHQIASERKACPKERKIRPGTALYDYVAAGLRRHWSPEQTGRRMLLDFPDNEAMRACHETIYQAIYVQGRGELRKDLAKALRKGRAARRPRNDGQSRRPRFREPMVMISERPADVADRAVPGHWEGDLICGTANRSAIGTLVERATRYTILLALPDGHDAEHVQQAIIDKMGRLPRPLPDSLTWDQGAELALHRRITAALDMQVYFCNPRSPWQRGLPTRTPTACCANTSPRAQTFPDTARTTSTPSPTNSTTGREKPSTGPNPPKESSSCSTPCNTLNKANNHNDMLQQPLESADCEPCTRMMSQHHAYAGNLLTGKNIYCLPVAGSVKSCAAPANGRSRSFRYCIPSAKEMSSSCST